MTFEIILFGFDWAIVKDFPNDAFTGEIYWWIASRETKIVIHVIRPLLAVNTREQIPITQCAVVVRERPILTQYFEFMWTWDTDGGISP